MTFIDDDQIKRLGWQMRRVLNRYRCWWRVVIDSRIISLRNLDSAKNREHPLDCRNHNLA